MICDQLRDAAGEHGLTFSADPATHDRCTLGGMIGNNSCGTHSVMGGKTVDNVIELDIVTYDGTRMTVGPTSAEDYDRIVAGGGRRAEIYRSLRDLAYRYEPLIRERFPEIPRRVSGYNLPDLLPDKGFNVARALVGTEIDLRARAGGEGPAAAGSAASRFARRRATPTPRPPPIMCPELLQTEGPIGLECFDAGVLDNLAKHGEHIPRHGRAARRRRLAAGRVRRAGPGRGERRWWSAARTQAGDGRTALFEDQQGQNEVWEVRRSTIEYTRIPGEHSGLAGWEDAAVAPERLGDYLRDYCALVARHGYHTVLFGHFGQGCMHNRLDLDLQTAAGVENFRRFLDEAGDLVVRYGGSLSGEHGDGQLRANRW